MFIGLPPPGRTAPPPLLPGPPGFDACRQRLLTESRAHGLDARFAPADAGPALLGAYDVEFGGHRVRGRRRGAAAVIVRRRAGGGDRP
ncbi:hypothetical protein GCM10017688_45240 [Streptomyces ramulosus]